MEQFANGPRQGRWWRSRKLVSLALLIAIAIGAFWLYDWASMPDDQRRMQGTWKVVKLRSGDKVEVDFDQIERVVFTGRRVTLPGTADDPIPIEVRDGKFFLYYTEKEQTILGVKVRLPLWLTRPSGCMHGTYEFKDRQLVLWIKGEMHFATKEQHELEDGGEGLYMERE